MTVTAFQQANQLLREGKLEEAVVAYRSAISNNPDFYLAYHNLGEALEKLGHWEESVEAYEQALELKPEAAWSLLGLSQVLQQVGRVDEAQQAREKAAKIEPKLASFAENSEGIKGNILELDRDVLSFEFTDQVDQENQDSQRPLFLSILTVSKSADNVSKLLDSIAISIELDIGEFEVLCSWNGSKFEEKDIFVPSGVQFNIVDRSSYHFASNINILASKASGDHLCIINDDVKLRPETLSNGLKWLDYFNVGIVGSILLFPNGKIQHCGISFKPDMTPFHIDKCLNLHESVCMNAPRVVEACTGALFFVKKEIFNSIKMIESFQECGEDICFSIDVTFRTGLSIVIPNDVIAEHKEGYTRGKLGSQGTPDIDLTKFRSHVAKHRRKKPSISIETEEKGWIFYRMAEEIKQNLLNYDVKINATYQSPDIIYFIHYARYNEEQVKGRYAVANFTHFVSGTNAEALFYKVAQKVDHCIAISQSTRRELLAVGIPDEKISVVEIGAAKEFKPKIVIGIVGRIYNDGRKGEDLVKRLSLDPDISNVVELVSIDDCWGVKTLQVNSHELFYSLIDYLLVPSRVEGGPVPFMEALACGKLSIAPPIGVIPSFPHIGYNTGDYNSMKTVILKTAYDRIVRLEEIAKRIKDKNWERWAFEHHLIFDSLLKNKTQKDFTDFLFKTL